MRIAISGSPGSRHHKIASMLADRLTLELISARELISTLPITEPDRERKTRTSEFDIKLNVALLQAALNYDDYVADGLVSFNIPDTVKIYIDRDLTEEILYPETLLEEYIEDIAFRDKYVWNASPDIYLNRTTLSDDRVVDIIIAALVKGGKHCYVPLTLCLPNTEIVNAMSELNYGIESVRLEKYNNLFIITHYVANEDLSIEETDVVDVISPITDITKTTLNHPALYMEWMQKLKHKEILTLNLLLNRYCKDKGIISIYDTYAKLMHNGNALSKLMLIDEGK